MTRTTKCPILSGFDKIVGSIKAQLNMSYDFKLNSIGQSDKTWTSPRGLASQALSVDLEVSLVVNTYN